MKSVILAVLTAICLIAAIVRFSAPAHAGSWEGEAAAVRALEKIAAQLDRINDTLKECRR